MAFSTEFGRANADYVTRSLSGISTGGILVTGWAKAKHALGASASRGNLDVARIVAGDWSIRAIACNGSTNAASIGNLNCNLMLFTEPGSSYISDFAYYDTTGYTAGQLNAWLWCAWWLQPGSTFTMKQWLRVAGAGGVFLATSGGTDVSTDIPGADDPPTSLEWSNAAASTPDNAYLWHGTIRAMATEPTIAQLDALCLKTTPDTGAFGDWPLEFAAGALGPSDQSGNARSVTPNGGSTFYQGSVVPLLATVYMGASAISYSATSPTPDYSTIPNPLAANDGILLFVAQKPTTANGGTVTTPSGFTLIGSKLAAGGYGATTGADVGNLNYLVYKKDTVSGSESGTLSITTSDNNVAFAWFAHFRSSNGVYDFEVGTAEDTTGGNLSLAFGAINVAAGDVLIAAFAEPTDVTTPAQFSAQAISGSGLTADVFVEINEPDSGTGNDIGGVSYVAEVTAASGSTAVTVTATAGGTTTNVRGPGLLVRVRQGTVTAADQPFRRRARIEDIVEDPRPRRVFAPITGSAPVVNDPPPRGPRRGVELAPDEVMLERRLLAPGAYADRPFKRPVRRLDDVQDEPAVRRPDFPIPSTATPDNPPPRASTARARMLADESRVEPDPRTRKPAYPLRGSIGITADRLTTAVDLTAIGTSDWKTFVGTATPGDAIRKIAGGSQISDWSLFSGGAPAWTPGFEPNVVQWSDGNPTLSGSHSGILSLTGGFGTGFTWTVPADQNVRTLHLYLGALNLGLAAVEVTVSDGSFPYSSTNISTDGEWNIHITYNAASPGQTITVTLYVATVGATQQVHVRGLALAGPAAPADLPPFFRRLWQRLATWDTEEPRAAKRLAPILPAVVPDGPPPRVTHRAEEMVEEPPVAKRQRVVPQPVVTPDDPPPRFLRRPAEEATDEPRARRPLAPIAPAAVVDSPPPRARLRIVDVVEEERAARRARAPIASTDAPPPRTQRRREEEPESIIGRVVRKLVQPAAVVNNPPPRAGRSNWRIAWETWEPVHLLRKVYKLVFPGIDYPPPVLPLHIVENDVVKTIVDTTSLLSLLANDTVLEVSPMKPRKVGDTSELFSGTLYSNGAPRSLAGSSLALFMVDSRTGAVRINGAALTLEPSGTGTWSYAPVPADVNTAGVYDYEIRETTGAGKLAHYPSSGYGRLVIEAALG